MYFFSYLHFAVALIYLCFALAIIRLNHRSILNWSAAAAFSCFFIWSFSFVFVHHPAVSRDTARIFLNISAIGGIVFPVFLLWLALLIRGVRSKLLFLVTLLLPLVLITAQFSGFPMTRIAGSVAMSYGWRMVFTDTIWYRLYAVHSTVTTIAVLLLLVGTWKSPSHPRFQRTQAKIMLGAGFCAIALNYGLSALASQLSLSQSMLNDTAFLGWAAVIYVGIHKYRLFSASPENSPVEILNTIRDGIVITDRENKVTYANPEAQRMFHTHLDHSFSPATLGIDEEDMADSRGSRNFRGTIVDSEGNTSNLLVATSFVRKNDETIQGRVFAIRDISEFLRMQNELERTQRFETLGIFAGGIAHDLNNMLGGLFGYVDLARICEVSDSPAAPYLQKACATFPSLIGLTRQLLSFAKGSYPSAETFDVVPVVQHAAQLALSGSAIVFEFDGHKDVKLVKADAGQVTQVINNLVVNARQAMAGRGTISARVSNAPAPANMVEIIVSDTGPGIPENVLPNIFSPFYTTKEHGSGLGLSTSKRIIEHHNGVLEILKTSSKGSIFRILLPASDEEIRKEISLDHAVTESKTGTVLVVDDDQGIREMATDLLKCLGYEVTAVGIADSAISEIRTAIGSGQKLTAAILDFTLKGEDDGFSLAGRIRDHAPDLPLILSSGYSFDVDSDQDKLDMFSGVLKKPYTLADVTAVMSHLSQKATAQN